MRNAARGQQFGKYRLLTRLARGGMAEIYRARYQGAAGITKQVVVKKILPTYADNKRFVQMFVDEAKITVGLSHGNIAQVFDFGEISGEYFLAMEFIHGQSLSRVQARAEELGLVIPVPIACFMVMEMCKGLHYAHRKTDDKGNPLGIVHRDVSPQNVMISYEGQVKLVDFGIAKAATVAGNTEAGALKGKYLYFAPEQARGREIDGRADICATGIVLYELLTGRRPYTGQLVDVLDAIVGGRFTRPGQINRELPPSLERIVLKAMAPRKEERYQTALDLQEALATFLYTAAPRFTSANLAHYMQYLFQEELLAEGLSVDLPAEFMEQLPLWETSSGLKTRSTPGTEETDPGDFSTDGGGPSTRYDRADSSAKGSRTGLDTGLESGSTSAETNAESGLYTTDRMRRPKGLSAATKRRLRLAGLMSIPVVLMAIVAGAVVSATQAVTPTPGAGMVAVESKPAGATIFLDGAPTNERTPHVFQGLLPGRTYGITLRLDGHEPLLTSVTPSAEGPVTVDGALEAYEAAAPRPSVDEIEAQLRDEAREAAHREAIARPRSLGSTLQQLAHEMGQMSGPGAEQPGKAITVKVAVKTLDVRRLPTLRFDLNPAQKHTLTVAGTAYLGDPVMSQAFSSCFYIVERRGASKPEDTGVLELGKAVRIEAGARRVHFVVADEVAKDNEGSLLVAVEDDTGLVRERSLDPKKHVFSPRRKGATRLRGLDVTSKYQVVTEAPPLLYFQGLRLKGLQGMALTDPPIGEIRHGHELRGMLNLWAFRLAPEKTHKAKPAELIFERR